MKNSTNQVILWNNLLIILILLVGIVSCEKQPNPIQSSERAKIEAIFKQRGFTIIPASAGARQSDKDSKKININTVAEAEAFLQSMDFQINQQNEVQSAKEDKQNKNGRAAFIACDDLGGYYISRAIGNAVTGINVHYERIGPDGHLGNIITDLTGWGVVGWDQKKVAIYDPKYEFCIDGIMTYGIDIQGLPLNIKAQVSIRVKMRAGDCGVMVTSRYGRCGE